MTVVPTSGRSPRSKFHPPLNVSLGVSTARSTRLNQPPLYCRGGCVPKLETATTSAAPQPLDDVRVGQKLAVLQDPSCSLRRTLRTHNHVDGFDRMATGTGPGGIKSPLRGDWDMSCRACHTRSGMGLGVGSNAIALLRRNSTIAREARFRKSSVSSSARWAAVREDRARRASYTPVHVRSSAELGRTLGRLGDAPQPTRDNHRIRAFTSTSPGPSREVRYATPGPKPINERLGGSCTRSTSTPSLSTTSYTVPPSAGGGAAWIHRCPSASGRELAARNAGR